MAGDLPDVLTGISILPRLGPHQKLIRRVPLCRVNGQPACAYSLYFLTRFRNFQLAAGDNQSPRAAWASAVLLTKTADPPVMTAVTGKVKDFPPFPEIFPPTRSARSFGFYLALQPVGELYAAFPKSSTLQNQVSKSRLKTMPVLCMKINPDTGRHLSAFIPEKRHMNGGSLWRHAYGVSITQCVVLQ